MSLRIAVIGVGHLGQHHARILAGLDGAQLEAVCDTDEERGTDIAARQHVPYLAQYEDLIDLVDAVDIVVPTAQHYETARFFLERGVHVFVEKPITRTVAEADELIALADQNALVLQVGHIERFNSALQALQEYLHKPLFIESHRLSLFQPRVKDVGAVLDLMIHDLDIILGMVRSELLSVEAVGVPVLTAQEDIANARLHFANGCIANVTVSRVSPEPQRRIRIFKKNLYASVDYLENTVRISRKAPAASPGAPPELMQETHTIASEEDALTRELKSFVAAVTQLAAPAVSGRDGRAALALAIRITDAIRLWQETALQ